MEYERNIKVLVVEENENDFAEMTRHLEKVTDFEVTPISSYSYQDASTLFKKMNIDVCFLKAEMKNASGDEFLEKLNEERKHTPIILVYGETADEKLLADDGVNEYVLRKNLSPDVLNKSIRHAIENNEINLQLQAQEEKYSKLFYSSLEAVFTINDEYEVLECNKSFRELFKVDDLSTFDFKSVFLNDSQEDLFNESSKPKNRRVRKTKIVNTEGEEIVAYFSVTRVESEIDENQYLGIIHDVTELENAQKKLAESDKLEMIQRMARIIGHEVRNPLTNIFLATEELKQDFSENEDAIDMLNMIHRNSTRISDLIDNFLKNAHTDKVLKEPHNIENVLMNSIKTCSDRITLKQIDFTTSGLDSETNLMLDQNKVSIAFTNILINAIEALEGIEEPFLSVKMNNATERVQLMIEDNGIGMSDETKKNLFTPFYSNKQGGLGLGMANTYGILKAHEAEVEVESEPNQGTRFTISFPVESY